MREVVSIKKVGVILIFGLVLFLLGQCQHEPYPAPNFSQNPVDTTTNTPTSGKPCDPDTIYYLRDVQPLLNANCAFAGCHDAGSAQDGVNLSNYNAVISTADVRPFDLEGSDLYEVITETDPSKRMPPAPNNALDPKSIEIIRNWILQGALNLNCDECDTLNLTYNNGIKSIIDLNCGNCHGATNPNAGLSLTNYTEVKDAFLNTQLLNRISNKPGVPVMPPAGPMDSCKIKSLEIWFANGMIE